MQNATEAEWVGLCALGGPITYEELAMINYYDALSILQKFVHVKRPYREPTWPEDDEQFEQEVARIISGNNS